MCFETGLVRETEVEKRIKQATPQLTLDEREAGGLLNEKKKP